MDVKDLPFFFYLLLVSSSSSSFSFGTTVNRLLPKIQASTLPLSHPTTNQTSLCDLYFAVFVFVSDHPSIIVKYSRGEGTKARKRKQNDGGSDSMSCIIYSIQNPEYVNGDIQRTSNWRAEGAVHLFRDSCGGMILNFLKLHNRVSCFMSSALKLPKHAAMDKFDHYLFMPFACALSGTSEAPRIL